MNISDEKGLLKMQINSQSEITTQRKDQHIDINLEKPVASALSSGFEKIRFVHQALPELDYENIDTRLNFLGHPLKMPLLISCMTGGTARTHEINNRLAVLAETYGIAMGLGSMRILLEDPKTLPSFDVRKEAPNLPFLIANLGAVQLNYGVTPDDCQRLVDLVGADTLVLHLNPLQEAVQPEGDKNWDALLPKIEKVVRRLSVPVMAKEVGYGISNSATRMLLEVGVQAIDIAGAGGTSWSEVEAYRAKTELQREIAQSFIDWGIPTRSSLKMIRKVSQTLPVIASGGMRTGIEAAKALHEGAQMVGMAAPFLKAAVISEEAVEKEIQLFHHQLKITMMCTASRTLQDLCQAETYISDK